LRETVLADVDGIESEEQLDSVLEMVESQIIYELEAEGLPADDPEAFYSLSDEEQATDVLAAIDAWASLASNVVGRFYAPASPWPRRLQGWAKSVAKRLRKIAGLLRAALQAVAQALSAASYSIGVSFPFGISVSIGW
jgi:hypothetical protein